MADTGGRVLQQSTPAVPMAIGEKLGFLRRIVRAFERRLWLFLLILGVALVAALVFGVSATRQYTATALVQLDVRNAQLLNQNLGGVSGAGDEVAIQTETEVMRSPSLAGRVVDALNLTEDPLFAPSPRGSLWAQVRALATGRSAQSASPAEVRAETIQNVRRQVRVDRASDTLIVRISATTPDPQRSADLANGFAENYLTMQLETKFENIQAANEFIATRLSALREELSGKEQAVEEERARMGVMSPGGATLTEQAIMELNSELQRARADLAASQARANGASSGASAVAGDSASVTALRQRQAELQRQRADLSTRYGPRHPEMMAVEREITETDARIREQLGMVQSNLRGDVRAAQQRVRSIENSLAGVRGNLDQSNIGSVRLRDLERDAEASRTTLEGFLARFRQVAETSGIERADARVVSAASAPLQASWPRLDRILLLGLLAGLVLGTLAVALVELFEQALRTPEDVGDKLDLPWLASTPFLDRRTRVVDGALVAPEDFVLKRPMSAFGEAMRTVRAGVFFANPDQRPRVVCVTSALPNEGKTTTAVSLARIAAMAGSNVVLVDCDLRRRSATNGLGLQVDQGLTEVLFKSCTLEEALQMDEESGCAVLPLAQAEFTPRDLFGSQAMRQLLDTLRARYDMVILDSAPVIPIADTRVLAGLSDAVILVVRWGKTPAHALRQAVNRLTTHGGQIVGVVLSGTEQNLVSRLIYDKREYGGDLYSSYYIN